MKYVISLLAVSLLASCAAKPGHEPKDVFAGKLEQVRIIRDKYCGWAFAKYMEGKFAVLRCDSLLFTSLHVCGYESILQFEYPVAGKWNRDPDYTCFDPDDPESTEISKDMLSGALQKMARDRDLAMAERTLAYCKDHEFANGLGCKMGEGGSPAAELTHTVWPVTTVNFLDHMIIWLKGGDLDYAQRIPPQGGPSEGFRGHLQVVGQLTEGIVYGNITDGGKSLLDAHAEGEPKNPLYAGASALYATGNMERAADLWLQQNPPDRLPNNHQDTCSDYRYQRGYNSTDKFGRLNWPPCPEDPFQEWFGTDAIYAAAVILGEVK